MNENNGFGGIGIILAFVSGAAAGAVAAVLLAPKSGAETRSELRHLAQDGADKMGRLPGAIKDAYQQGSEQAREAFTESYKAGDHSIAKAKA